MSSNEVTPVKIPKWLHLVFVVLAMLLVYRLTVWSEGEVRDERYYQRSMSPADLVRQFADKLFTGVDPATVAGQYIAQDVNTPVGAGREAVQSYYAAAVANGAQLVGVASTADTAFLQYTINGQVRLDVLRVQAGEIVEHTPYTRASSAE